MEGCKVVVANAVAASDDDPRPVVKDLIHEHSALIKEMVLALASNEWYDSSKHDDLWCLRFLRSHKKNVEAAIRAAQATLRFRKEYGLDELGDIRAIAPQDYQNLGSDTAFFRFMAGGVGEQSVAYVVPSASHQVAGAAGVLTYIDIGTLETHKLAELPIEDWIAGLAYVNEWNYQWLDYLTRTTGRLTKSVRIVDVGTASLGQIDWNCQNKYTKAVSVMQDCFPQAVQSIYVCFAPGWVYRPWKLIRPFLPTRVVEKMDFLDPLESQEDRERLLQHASSEQLPVRFGGKNETLFPARSVEAPELQAENCATEKDSENK